jgi:hypothetical protein
LIQLRSEFGHWFSLIAGDDRMKKAEREKYRDLIREFRSQPYGRHSPALQHMLNDLRLKAKPPRYAIVCRQPGREWVLAKLGDQRGAPIEILENQIFTSRAEAEWLCFRLRWQTLNGEDPELSYLSK